MSFSAGRVPIRTRGGSVGIGPLRRFCARVGSWRSERGQALVFCALLMVPLCGMAGAAIDVGSWYAAQRRTQTAADATVLAAATALPYDPATATALASQYAQANGRKISPGDLSYSSWAVNNDTVSVRLQTAAPTFFAELLGVNNVKVVATASARTYPLNQATGASPFGIINTQPELAGHGCPCYKVTTTLELAKVGPGSFKIINIDGSHGGNGGPGTLATWIQNGFSGPMGIGWFYSMPGAKFNSSQVKAAMDARIGSDLLFPVYDQVQGNGANLQYHVIGWAAFNIQSYTFKGNSGTITGWFDHVTWAGIANTTGGGTNYGVTTIYLVH